MGTSASYGGPRSGLVPSWVDDAAGSGTPAGAPPASGAAPGIGPAAPSAQSTSPESRPRFTASPGGSLSGARGNFTRFARNGDRSALGRALSSYVRGGTGGSARAARRMGASRAVAGKLLGIVRDVQRVGGAEALRQRFNLQQLAGRPAADVFLALMEFVCPPGGTVDDGIARQAMLEAVGDLAEAGVGNFDAMTRIQLEEFFLNFVIRSVESRIVADIGSRSITLPASADAVELVQQQLHDFVAGCTRSELAGQLDGLERLKDQEINATIDRIYEAGFDVLVAAADQAAEGT